MSTKPANVRTRILLAAKELFSTQGIRATGVDTIVKSANINKMSLYKHFSSKEALIVAYLQNSDSEFWSWFVEQIEVNARTPKDKLIAIFDVHAGWLVSPDFQGCPLIKASVEFPDQSHPVHQVSAAFYRKFRSYMTDLAGQAGAQFPERLAGQLCVLFQGAIVSEQLQRNSVAGNYAKLAAEILIAINIE
ncbi:TetR/AcrR family transcriptional regulator [Methylomonas koyamae]|uniref:TetR/AcrR family transcriptional regulator n=1 Tax=Methylomonas koyamae TaxID=702114 RepID=UPI001128081F|nr:TetR/AcrR family transcriptional regulator [Methylomonas koyamae]TPQ25054.1 TetR family transcriptional regulator [Methylomonas koyamae]